jgi:hypothetical protein
MTAQRRFPGSNAPEVKQHKALAPLRSAHQVLHEGSCNRGCLVMVFPGEEEHDQNMPQRRTVVKWFVLNLFSQ